MEHHFTKSQKYLAFFVLIALFAVAIATLFTVQRIANEQAYLTGSRASENNLLAVLQQPTPRPFPIPTGYPVPTAYPITTPTIGSTPPYEWGGQSCVNKITYAIMLPRPGAPTPPLGLAPTYCGADIECKGPVQHAVGDIIDEHGSIVARCGLKAGSERIILCRQEGSMCYSKESWEYYAKYWCGNTCVNPVVPTGGIGIEPPPAGQPQ